MCTEGYTEDRAAPVRGVVRFSCRTALIGLAVAAGTLPGVATARTASARIDCGAAVAARFSEASRWCAAPASPPATAATTGTTPLPAAIAPVAVAEQSPVSVRMPGFDRRLAAAVRQVRRRGGASAPDALVVAIGRQYRIDPHLLAAMVATESAGDPRAVSPKGALGVMQVMPATARSLGVRDPRALLGNRPLALATGAAYLKQLQRRFGNNVPLVVAAYNAGPGAVQKYRGVPRYRETQGYVRDVLGRYATARGAAQ